MLVVALLALLSATTYGIERAVLLKNGNVMQGDVSQLEGRVHIRTATSEVRISARDVELVARSLPEIYVAKSKRVSNRPTARKGLVLWCLRNGLRSEAAHELTKLRNQFPSYSQLDILEKRVQAAGKRRAQTTLPGKSPVQADLQFALERLDQLSNRTLAEYTRTIQPLLTNRCGLAGCHGNGGESSYELISRGHSVLPLSLTRRNLGATLRRIDGVPDQSLLWMSATAVHGGMKRPLEASAAAKLRSWIGLASEDLGIARRQGSQLQQVNGEETIDGQDPFDPREFNEQ